MPRCEVGSAGHSDISVISSVHSLSRLFWPLRPYTWAPPILRFLWPSSFFFPRLCCKSDRFRADVPSLDIQSGVELRACAFLAFARMSLLWLLALLLFLSPGSSTGRYGLRTVVLSSDISLVWNYAHVPLGFRADVLLGRPHLVWSYVQVPHLLRFLFQVAGVCSGPGPEP